MTKLYHNNRQIFELKEIGFKGAKLTKEVTDYIEIVTKRSPKSSVHIFKLEGEYFENVFTLVFNPKTKRWNLRTVANFTK